MDLPKDKKVYAFELDDVLFPRRDYILQVYYLFAQFVDFTEGKNAALEIVDFMKDTYESAGEEGMVEKMQHQFKLTKDYTENFARLLANAHLPAKLFLYDDVRDVIVQLQNNQKYVAVLTKGNPVEQLNKLRHIDWQGLDNALKVYFVDELHYRNLNPIDYLAKDYSVQTNMVVHIDRLARD